MADPAYLASGTFAETATKNTNITPGLPAAADGSFQILHVTASGFGTGIVSPTIVETGLTGWRRLGRELYASGFANTRSPRSRFYYRVRQSGDAAPTVQMTGGTNDGTSARVGGRIHAFSNVGVVRFCTSIGAVGDTSPITGPAVVTKAANGLLVAFTAMGDGNTLNADGAFASAGAATERTDDSVATRLGMGMLTAVQTSAGSSGAFTVTPSAIDPWTVMVFALEELEAFPSEAVLDDFNRADGALGANWSPDTFSFSNPAPTISSNRLVGIAGDNRAYYSLTQHLADGQVAATVPVLAPTNEKAALAWRVQGPDTAGVDGYEVESNQTGDGLRIFRVDNQSYTQIGLLESPLVAGDKMGVRFTGSSHEFYLVPSSGPKLHLGTITDATYTSGGYGGLTLEGTTVRVDDFVLGPLVSLSAMESTGTLDIDVEGLLVADPQLPATIELLMTGSAVMDDLLTTPPALAPRSHRTSWTVVLYSKDGTRIGPLRELQGQTVTYRHRGIDQFSFTMRLEAKLADEIEELSTSVRMWRRRDGITPNPLFPDFAGVVGPIVEDGDAGTFTVTCFSPLWKLRGRHLHTPLRLTEDQSDLVMSLISHTNAFDHTGIYPGALESTVTRTREWEQDQNIWQAIEELMLVLGGINVMPVYVADDPVNGPAALMRLTTSLDRGALRPDAALHWRVGKRNVEGGFSRSSSVEPGEYGNYVSMLGQVAADAGIRAVNMDAAEITARGLYEIIETRDNVQTFAALDALSQDLLDRRKFPIKVIGATISPINGPVYGLDYTVGDTLPVVGRRGRLQVASNLRAHEATLSLSDNGTERTQLALANEEA